MSSKQKSFQQPSGLDIGSLGQAYRQTCKLQETSFENLTVKPELAIVDSIASHLVAHVLHTHPLADCEVLQRQQAAIPQCSRLALPFTHIRHTDNAAI